MRAEFVTTPFAPEGFVIFDDFMAAMQSDPRISQALPAARMKLSILAGKKRSLASLRLMKGLSQSELADSIGTSQPVISAYESGAREPSLQVAAKLASQLDVSLDDLAKLVIR